MSKLYTIRDRAGNPVYNIVAPNVTGGIEVSGLPGATVTESDFKPEAFRGFRVNFPGRRVTLQLSGKLFGQTTNFHSLCTTEFFSEVSGLKLVFEDLRKVRLQMKHLVAAFAHLVVAAFGLIAISFFVPLGLHFPGDVVVAMLLGLGYGFVAVAAACAVLFLLNLLWGVTLLGFALDNLVSLAVSLACIEGMADLLPAIVSIDSHLDAFAGSVGLVLLFNAAAIVSGMLKLPMVPTYLTPRTWRSQC